VDSARAIAPANPEGEPLMTKTIVLSALIAAGLTLAPAYAQDSMKKDTMSKDTMKKDGMSKDTTSKDGMKK
jgi:pentapeptide MXKDX repeat protein